MPIQNHMYLKSVDNLMEPILFHSDLRARYEGEDDCPKSTLKRFFWARVNYRELQSGRIKIRLNMSPLEFI